MSFREETQSPKPERIPLDGFDKSTFLAFFAPAYCQLSKSILEMLVPVIELTNAFREYQAFGEKVRDITEDEFARLDRYSKLCLPELLRRKVTEMSIGVPKDLANIRYQIQKVSSLLHAHVPELSMLLSQHGINSKRKEQKVSSQETLESLVSAASTLQSQLKTIASSSAMLGPEKTDLPTSEYMLQTKIKLAVAERRKQTGDNSLITKLLKQADQLMARGGYLEEVSHSGLKLQPFLKTSPSEGKLLEADFTTFVDQNNVDWALISIICEKPSRSIESVPIRLHFDGSLAEAKFKQDLGNNQGNHLELGQKTNTVNYMLGYLADSASATPKDAHTVTSANNLGDLEGAILTVVALNGGTKAEPDPRWLLDAYPFPNLNRTSKQAEPSASDRTVPKVISSADNTVLGAWVQPNKILILDTVSGQQHTATLEQTQSKVVATSLDCDYHTGVATLFVLHSSTVTNTQGSVTDTPSSAAKHYSYTVYQTSESEQSMNIIHQGTIDFNQPEQSIESVFYESKSQSVCLVSNTIDPLQKLSGIVSGKYFFSAVLSHTSDHHHPMRLQQVMTHLLDARFVDKQTREPETAPSTPRKSEVTYSYLYSLSRTSSLYLISLSPSTHLLGKFTDTQGLQLLSGLYAPSSTESAGLLRCRVLSPGQESFHTHPQLNNLGMFVLLQVDELLQVFSTTYLCALKPSPT